MLFKINFERIKNKVTWDCMCGREPLSCEIPNNYCMIKRCLFCNRSYEIEKKEKDEIVVRLAKQSLSYEEKLKQDYIVEKKMWPKNALYRNIGNKEECLNIFEEAKKKLEQDIDEIERRPDNLSVYEDVEATLINLIPNLSKSPYYAKIDFFEGAKRVVYYIAKHRIVYASEKLEIIPWTAPIASLIYNKPNVLSERMLPQHSPSLPFIKKQFLLNEKEKYKIQNETLLEMQHIDSKNEFVTDGSKVLNFISYTDIQLSSDMDNEDTRAKVEAAQNLAIFKQERHYALNEIITLIREEQDSIIKAPVGGCILVKGAAGSGKTTIAIHRLVYLLNEFPDYFKQENIVVFVFNVALAKYLTRLIHELSIPKVHVTTVHKWMFHLISKNYFKFQYISLNEENSDDLWIKSRVFNIKAIREYIASRDHYHRKLILKEIENLGMDFIRKKKIKEMIEEKSLINISVLELLSKNTKTILEFTKKSVITRLTADEREDERCNVGLKRIFSNAIDKIGAYRNILAGYYESDVFRSYVEKERSRSQKDTIIIDDFISRHKAYYIENKLAGSDLILLLLIIYYLNDGIPITSEKTKKLFYDHIIIDEAQDIPAPLLFVYSKVTDPKTKSMTIVGDITQQLYPNVGFNTWDQVGINLKKQYDLKLSHRSTYEIMMFANKILGKETYKIDTTEANKVARFGIKPTLRSFPSYNQQIDFIVKKIMDIKKQDTQASIVVTHAVRKKLDDVVVALKNKGISCYKAFGNDFEFSPKVTVTTMHQVKGLEYDYVFITDLNTMFEQSHISNKKYLLYVNATRAQKELFVTYGGSIPEVIKEMPVEYYNG